MRTSHEAAVMRAAVAYMSLLPELGGTTRHLVAYNGSDYENEDEDEDES